jgi:hypothetical protein
MFTPVISSTGLFTPEDSISNEELVASFNAYVAQHNMQHEAAIVAGDVQALEPSSVEFIDKASGIKARYVLAKAPILDIDVMGPMKRLVCWQKLAWPLPEMPWPEQAEMPAMSMRCSVLAPICSALIRRSRLRFRMRWASKALALT